MRKFLILTLCALIILSATLISCTDEDDGKLTVAVTIEPIASFVRGVCGERVSVITAVPAGSSPESYDPTPREIARITRADIYFSIGLPTEDSILPLLSEDTNLVSLDAVCRETYEELKMGEGRDPHIWLSVARAKIMVSTICDKLCELDPEGTDSYRSEALSYLSELDTADRTARELLKDAAGKTFIVYHPSLAYFADEYSLDMRALEEGGKEADAKRLESMIRFARERGISTVLCQPDNPRKQVEALARELDGGTVVTIDVLSGDYAESIVKTATEISKAVR